MAKTQFLTYYICLSDPAQVEQYQQTQWIPAVTVPGTIPLGIVNRAITPGAADEEFGAPFRGFTEPFAPGENYIWTPYSGIGEEDGPFPLNVATFQRKTGGFWIFGGTTVRYYWMGQFVLVPAATASVGGVPAPPVDIATVCWADGFELPTDGEGASITSLATVSPDAARHLDGLGIALRGNSGAIFKTHQWNETGILGANPSEGWTRFYVRLRRAPDVLGKFWDCRTQTSSTAAAAMRFTSGRSLQLWTIQSTVESFHSAIPTFVADLNRWYRFDILLRVGLNPPNDGRFRLYVNGVLIYDVQITTNEGLGGGGASPRLTDCRMGTDGAISNMDLDIDDWSGHAMPNGSNPAFPAAGSFTGLDWLNGSMIALIRPPTFGPSHGAWTGDARQLQQRPVGGQTSVSGVVSTTSGAIMEVETDYNLSVKARSGYLAVSALVISAFHFRAAGTVDSILGYALDGTTFVSANISGGTIEDWDNTFLSRAGVGVVLPAEIAGPLRLRFTKSADVTSVTVRALQAVALLIGQFGSEDAPPDVAVDNNAETSIGIHNHPYPRTPWALAGLPPLSPIAIIGGVYVGNNLAQDLLSTIPAHWLWVRPLTGGLGGVNWWSTMLHPHAQQDLGGRSDVMVRARQNEVFNGLPGVEQQSQEFALTPSGSFSQANATGVSYQYIAICDPGQRIMLNGAFMHGTALASHDNVLPDSGFTPMLAWFFPEDLGNTGTNNLRWKGPGNGASAWQVVTGVSEQTSAIEFAAGIIRSFANAHVAGNMNIAFAAFRDNDGILDANGVTQRGKAVQMWSYVGDGAASRSLAFQVAVGRRPLFAVIGGINATTAIFRDPSHTANNSCDISNNNTTTGITAGAIDGLTVGISLNANGIVYNVFLVVGGTAAGNGGWGGNEILIPMEPDTAPGDQWGDEFPGEPTDAPDPDLVLSDEPDVDITTPLLSDAFNVGGLVGGQVCEVYTRSLVNIALSRIGITKTISNLATEQSEAAVTARRHIKEDINAVLRDHPWSFATRYDNLVLAAGSAAVPFNNDWTFAYTAPNGMMFGRRLAKIQKGRGFDDEPIPYRHYMSVTLGPLILCNAEASVEVPLVLEWTIRFTCPAFFGDAIFRDALAWRFAKSLAPGLSRDANKATYCEQMYRDVLARASAVVEKEQQQEKPGDADWISGRN